MTRRKNSVGDMFMRPMKTTLRRCWQVEKGDADWRNMGQPFMLSRAYARQAAPQMSQAMGTRFAEAVFAQDTQKGGSARCVRPMAGMWLKLPPPPPAGGAICPFG